MVDDQTERKRADLIAAINSIQDELFKHKVPHERFNPKMDINDLAEFAEAKREQLKRKRIFLGLEKQEK